MTRYPVTPFPFQSPKSFYDIGTGEETLKLRPEWAHIKERDDADRRNSERGVLPERGRGADVVL